VSVEQKVQNHFQNDARRFDQIYEDRDKGLFSRFVDTVWRGVVRKRFDLTLERLEPLEGKSVLDVGCGSGRYCIAYARRGASRVVGVDFAEAMIELARDHAREVGVESRCDFRAGAFPDAVSDGPFDASTAMGFFDYIERPAEIIARMRELTTSTMIMSFPRSREWRAPLRRLRFFLSGCPLFLYTTERVKQILEEAGVTNYELLEFDRDYVVVATMSGPRPPKVIRTPRDIDSDPLRVLHVITRMIVGGAQENTLLTVEGLNQMPEFDVTLASGVDKGPEGELLTRARAASHVIVIPDLQRNVNPLADLKAFYRLYRIICQGRYHIVHTHSSKAGVLGRIAAWLARTPIVVHTLHSLVFHDYQPWAINRTLRGIKKICAPITDHFVSVSEVIREKAIAAGIDRPEKFSTIYSGMELDWFLNSDSDPEEVRRSLGIPSDALVVGKIARLFSLKGHDQLLDAAPAIVRRHPNVRFLLIGDGVLYDHIRRRAAGAGILENFVFAGLIPRERIPEMISAMDVLVHTSLREGLARALPQALACGKPCVSFDIDGAREVVLDGETGFLIDPGDSPGLAQAVSRLLDDPALRQRMGEAGRELVAGAFAAEQMVNKIAELYRKLAVRHAERLSRFDSRLSVTVEVEDAATF
jgi:glycosyltransferase involved in cell wall biosynthesis